MSGLKWIDEALEYLWWTLIGLSLLCGIMFVIILVLCRR